MALQLPVTQVGLEASIQQAMRNAGRNAQINLGTNARQINALSQPLGRITGQADEFTKSMEAANARVFAFGASVGIINSVSKAFGALVSNTIKVEKTLTDINTVLNTNSKSLEQFGNSLFKVAKDTGQSFDIVAQGALELARQGLSTEETLKRINDALILSRLSGLDAAQSVEGLTAAFNSFKSSGATTSEILNKLVVVSQKFAVSERDLIEALKRSASVADQAGVSLDELIGIVTAVQERTARGGAVIGNAFKTIFARIQDKGALQDLQDLGIQVTDTAGKILPATTILQNLSKQFEQLSQTQQTDLAKKLGGVYQLSNLLAAVKDLSSEQSKYSEAVKLSMGATDQAYKKNAALNQTLDALINKVTVSAQQLGATLGAIGFTDSAKNLLGFFNGLLESIQNILGEQSAMGDFVRGLAKGLGNLITGPGLALFGAVIAKLSKDLVQFGFASLKSFFGIGKAAKEIEMVEKSVANALASNISLQKQLYALEGNRAAQIKLMTDAVVQQEAAMRRMTTTASTLAGPLYQQGVRSSGGQGLRVPPRAAEGYTPVAQESQAIKRGVGGAKPTDKPVVIPNFAFGSGKRGTMVAHTGEYIVPNYANGGSAIFNRNMVRSMGLPAGAKKIGSAGGFIPNFSDKISNKIVNMTEVGEIFKNPDKYPGSYTKSGSFKLANSDRYIPKTSVDRYASSAAKEAAIIDAAEILGPDMPTILTPSSSGLTSSIKKQNPFGNNRDYKFQFKSFALQANGKESIRKKFERRFGDKAIETLANKTALRYAQDIAKSLGSEDPVDPQSIQEVEKVKGFLSSAKGAFGGIFDAAVTTGLKAASRDNQKADANIGGDFDVNVTGDAYENIIKLFGPGSVPKNGLADFKINNGKDAVDSMINKVLKSRKFTERLAGINKGKYGAAGGYIPNFALNSRTVGYLDGDVLADPANADIVNAEIQKLGIKGGVVGYRKYLADLVAQARVQNKIKKFTGIYGVPGAGKSTMMLGGAKAGIADKAKARQTSRIPILRASDIDKVSEVIDTRASLQGTARELSSGYLQNVDRMMILSSSTAAEQAEIKKRRNLRDAQIKQGISNVSFGRTAGTAQGAYLDTAHIEALALEALGPNRVSVMGINPGFKLKRKRGEQLPLVEAKRLGLAYGAFSPSTKGHLEMMKMAESMGIPAKDFITAVSREGGTIDPNDPHSWRTALYPQSFRKLLAQKTFTGANVIGADPQLFAGGIPNMFEVASSGGRRRFLKAGEGSVAFVGSDKTDKDLEKYRKAGYQVAMGERTEGISGTSAREAIQAGDNATIAKLFAQDAAEVIRKYAPQIKNRGDIMPEIIKRSDSIVDKRVGPVLSAISEIEAKLGTKVLTAKVKAAQPELANELLRLRDVRTKYKDLKTKIPSVMMRRLGGMYPSKYGLPSAAGGFIPNFASPNAIAAMQRLLNDRAATEGEKANARAFLAKRGVGVSGSKGGISLRYLFDRDGMIGSKGLTDMVNYAYRQSSSTATSDQVYRVFEGLAKREPNLSNLRGIAKQKGFIPNFAQKSVWVEDEYGDEFRRYKVGKGSFLDFQLDDFMDEKSLKISTIYSKKKGDAYKLFLQLAKLSKRTKLPIYSDELVSQKMRKISKLKKPIDFEKMSNWDELMYSFPQLRYRQLPNLVTSGGFGHHSFETIDELKKLVGEMPKKEFQRHMFIGIGSLTSKYAAKGFLPNFADPLSAAIRREMSAGVPASQIYVDQSSSLRGAGNPMGLMVANRRDEPADGSQGINRAIREGRNPKTYGAANGFVPNYAIPRPMNPGASGKTGVFEKLSDHIAGLSTGMWFLSSVLEDQNPLMTTLSKAINILNVSMLALQSTVSLTNKGLNRALTAPTATSRGVGALGVGVGVAGTALALGGAAYSMGTSVYDARLKSQDPQNYELKKSLSLSEIFSYAATQEDPYYKRQQEKRTSDLLQRVQSNQGNTVISEQNARGLGIKVTSANLTSMGVSVPIKEYQVLLEKYTERVAKEVERSLPSKSPIVITSKKLFAEIENEIFRASQEIKKLDLAQKIGDIFKGLSGSTPYADIASSRSSRQREIVQTFREQRNLSPLEEEIKKQKEISGFTAEQAQATREILKTLRESSDVQEIQGALQKAYDQELVKGLDVLQDVYGQLTKNIISRTQELDNLDKVVEAEKLRLSIDQQRTNILEENERLFNKLEYGALIGFDKQSVSIASELLTVNNQIAKIKESYGKTEYEQAKEILNLQKQSLSLESQSEILDLQKGLSTERFQYVSEIRSKIFKSTAISPSDKMEIGAFSDLGSYMFKLKQMQDKYRTESSNLTPGTDQANDLNSKMSELAFIIQDIELYQQRYNDQLDITNSRMDQVKEKNKELSADQKAFMRKVEGGFAVGMQDSMIGLQNESDLFKYNLGIQVPQLFADNMSNAMMQVIEQSESIGDIFRNTAYNFVKEINSMMFKQAAGKLATSVFPSLFSSGGKVTGGSGAKDDVPAMLTGGEFVISKKAAQKYGPNFLNAINSGTLGGYAAGGIVKKDYFTPGTFGQGAIEGSSNLLGFATQAYTGGANDQIFGGGAAGVSLEPESMRLTNFGRRFGPAAEATRAAKEQAFGLYTQEYQAAIERAQQKKAEKKAFKRQLAAMAIMAAVSFGAGAASKGFKGAFDASKAANPDAGFGTNFMAGLKGSWSGSGGVGGLKNLFSGVEEMAQGNFKQGYGKVQVSQGNFKSTAYGLASIDPTTAKDQALADAGNPAYKGFSQTIGASGRKLIAGYSVASNHFPLGSILNINGKEYRVDDRGGMGANIIDFYAGGDKRMYNAFANMGALNVTRMRATGGSIPFTNGIDTVPSMLSGGEFIMNRSAAQSIGAGNLQALNAGASSLVTEETSQELNDRIIAKLDELIEATGNGAGNITINVDAATGAATQATEGNAGEDRQQLARQIKDVVLKVIQDEKRIGGQLRRGM